ncbi:hypothetical protein GX408_16585 [bacterium]|nr:hypothetical protein [bacterium]
MNLYDDLMDGLSAAAPLRVVFWEPGSVAVVVGYSQQPAVEVHVDRCRREGIPVMRRRGGGGAVVLMPGILCLTCAFASLQSDSPYYFFQKINTFLVEQLARVFHVPDVRTAGISDLVINERKILGCSMHKSRHHYLYQGSLLVDPELALITRYLRHPSREPDYRKGRGHEAFVTSLTQEGYPLSVRQLRQGLEAGCTEQLASILL